MQPHVLESDETKYLKVRVETKKTAPKTMRLDIRRSRKGLYKEMVQSVAVNVLKSWESIRGWMGASGVLGAGVCY